MERETTRMGRRGTIVIPAKLRRRLGLTEGSVVVAEAHDDGILLRPAVALPVESYSPERRAEFLLSNAVPRAAYPPRGGAPRPRGFVPDRVPHRNPEV